MLPNIALAVNSCLRKGKTVALLIPLLTIQVLFERNAMDLVGRLTLSHTGYRYVLVICDYSTRYLGGNTLMLG